MTVLALLALGVWLYLLAGRGFFWLARERDDPDPLRPPESWPSVMAVVPARDEADVISRSITSLIEQDYPGEFRVILVDDNSSDGTAAIAQESGERTTPGRLEVLPGQPLAHGWTGKLWAVSQGIAHAMATTPQPRYLLLTDADIAHAPDNLRQLVIRAEAGGLVLASLMAKLHCRTWAERLLIPAFVYFFQMLYPFARVNDPNNKLAAAAGGCMLVRSDALAEAGGIAAIRHAIIDDCALGRVMKAKGPIWLGLTRRASSIRPYRSIGDIGTMIARSAYAQLGYSPFALAATIACMALIYLGPPIFALLGGGMARVAGVVAWMLMALSFQPMLRFYRRSPLWGAALSLIAVVYGWFTLLSAVQFWRGRGGMWKGRAQALAQP